MAPRRNPSDLRLLTKVGTLYYVQGLTQQQIADRFQLSRPKVSRMLDEARQRGIVQITIAPLPEGGVEVEAQLEARFGLREAIVVDSTHSLRSHLGRAAAAYLQRSIAEGAVLGLTWGTTLNAMVEAVQRSPTSGVRVVQTLGGVGSPQAQAHAADLARRLAQQFDARPELLPAPGIVGRAAARDVLLEDPYLCAALDAMQEITVAFVGIGALSTNPIFSEGELSAARVLPEGLLEELSEKGAVGDIALRFFDGSGQPVETSLDARLVGISLDVLQRIPYVVGVAGGEAKVDAIRAALVGRLVNVLITDRTTAEHLLAD